jgi:hypothetical protein
VSTITERVARGAAFLDEREPGWAARIDLGRLNMDICHRCVLGQLAGAGGLNPYADKLRDLGLGDGGGYGFDIDSYGDCGPVPDLADDDAEYAALTAAWREVIAERRAAS